MKFIAVTWGLLLLCACSGVADTTPGAESAQKKDKLVGDVVLVADLNENGGSLPSEFADASSQFFFSAQKAGTEGGTFVDHGTELMVSDGTPAGTHLVVDASTGLDICPGSCSSLPLQLRAVGSIVFFTAFDNTHGRELWYALPSGARLVHEIQSGPSSTDIREITPFGSNGVFFSAFESGDSARSLWFATTSGATKIPGPANPAHLSVVNGKLYFAASGSNGVELWVSDATASGTVEVADINPGSGSSSPEEIVGLGTNVYFVADDGSTGREIWKYDGASASQVKDILVGTDSPFDQPDLIPELTVMGSTIYFVAETPTQGRELWKTDGTSSGTTIVKDLVPGELAPRTLTPAGTFLYFTADDGVNGRELWRTNGTAAGTVRFTDIEPGAGSSNPDHLVATPDELYFTADTTAHGRGIFRADIRRSDIVTYFSIDPDDEIGEVLGYFAMKGRVLFTGTFGSLTNFELWSVDVRKPEIIPGDPSAPTKVTGKLVSFNGVTYFPGNNANVGTELFWSDGLTSGVYDLNQGTGSSNPSTPVAMGSKLFLAGDRGVVGNNEGRELLYIDPSSNSVGQLPLCPASCSSSPQELTLVMFGTTPYLYFTAEETPGDRQVFYTLDGVNKTQVTNTPGLSPHMLTAVNGRVYFLGTTSGEGEELWSHRPGDPQPTAPIQDIYPGPVSSTITESVGHNAALYFAACDNVNECQLWRSNGTSAGTFPVSFENIGAGGLLPAHLTSTGGDLYFSGTNGSDGVEPWMLDSPTSVMMVDDINPTGSSSPSGFTEFNGEVYFSANDGTAGPELWKTGGPGYSQRVWDLRAGTVGSNPRPLITVASQRLYFTANDGVSGIELHYTDGVSVWSPFDFNPGTGSSSPADFVQVPGGWLFSASDGTAGRKLWFGDNL